MHNTYNLKPGKRFNNDRGGPATLNKTINISKITNIIDNILKFKPQQTKVDEDVVFILNYNSFVPKTSRLLFEDENEIIDDVDIPWKNVCFLKGKKFQIFYKINEKYWNNFILKIQKIKDRHVENLENWVAAFKGQEKEDFINIINLLSKLSSEKPIQKPIFENSENNKTFIYLVELIPLKRELILKIFKIINKENELASEINKNLLEYNNLIIFYETLNLLISYGFDWIIKNSQKKEIYDFKLDIPKEIEYLIKEDNSGTSFAKAW